MIKLILLSDFTESFAYKILKGVLEYSRRHEAWVVSRMPPSYRERNGVAGVLEWAKFWEADAILGRFENEEEALAYRNAGMVVFAQDYKERFSRVPSLSSDYIATGRMAAQFFVQKGYTSFAFVGYRDAFWSKERCMGFQHFLEEAGYGNNLSIYEGQSIDDVWFYEMPNLVAFLKNLPHGTAVFACDDNQGSRLTEICKVNDIKIPIQLAILGVDNDETVCSLSDPPLSSILLDVEQTAHDVAMQIAELLNGTLTDATDVVGKPIKVVERISTDIITTDDPHVRVALKYIHEHATTEISVEDVLQQVPLCRRQFEKRFREATHLSVYKYILELRIARFAQALLLSEGNVKDIATDLGFLNYKSLSRQFKLITGLSPLRYREQNKNVLNE